MQINTKLGLVDIPNEVILAAARDLGASVIPPREPQGHSSAFAVAGGCLPVVEAEAVAKMWLERSINNNTRAAEHRAAGRNEAAICCETWSAAYLLCADELSQLRVLPSQRKRLLLLGSRKLNAPAIRHPNTPRIRDSRRLFPVAAC